MSEIAFRKKSSEPVRTSTRGIKSEMVKILGVTRGAVETCLRNGNPKYCDLYNQIFAKRKQIVDNYNKIIGGNYE